MKKFLIIIIILAFLGGYMTNLSLKSEAQEPIYQLRLVKTGTITIAANDWTDLGGGYDPLDSQALKSVSHGLGYTPIMLAYIVNASGEDPYQIPLTVPIVSNTANNGKIGNYYGINVDDTNINVSFYSQTLGNVYYIKYYLFERQGT